MARHLKNREAHPPSGFFLSPSSGISVFLQHITSNPKLAFAQYSPRIAKIGSGEVTVKLTI